MPELTNGRYRAGLITDRSEADELRSLFIAVAGEQGWEPGEDLGGLNEPSAFVAAYVENRLAGGIELRFPAPCGRLPVFAAWPELRALPLTSPAELVLLALRPERRGDQRLLWTLCVEMWRHCVQRGTSDLLIAAPPRNARIYGRLGWSPEIVGPERLHWGEPCVPCRIGVEAVAKSVEEKVRNAPSLGFVLDLAHRA